MSWCMRYRICAWSGLLLFLAVAGWAAEVQPRTDLFQTIGAAGPHTKPVNLGDYQHVFYVTPAGKGDGTRERPLGGARPH